MKNSIKILAAIAILGFAGNASAQTSASTTASASATIISGITLSHDADLTFGKIVNDGVGGTVTVNNNGTINYGTLTTTLTPGTIGAAKFTVGGQSGAGYNVTLTEADAVPTANRLEDGAGNELVFSFNGTPATAITGTLGTVGGQFAVGGSVAVTAGANTNNGAYTGTITCQVQYN
ncbi:MAG: DUF4402 domain-containing protein [Candidatus Kapaibacterium sp.]